MTLTPFVLHFIFILLWNTLVIWFFYHRNYISICYRTYTLLSVYIIQCYSLYFKKVFVNLLITDKKSNNQIHLNLYFLVYTDFFQTINLTVRSFLKHWQVQCCSGRHVVYINHDECSWFKKLYMYFLSNENITQFLMI